MFYSFLKEKFFPLSGIELNESDRGLHIYVNPRNIDQVVIPPFLTGFKSRP
jgi:hypothetical protein